MPAVHSVIGSYRLLRGRGQVLRVLESARGLFEATETPVSARTEWLSAWLAAFDAVEPIAVVAGDPTDPTGLACLAVARLGPLRTVTLLGDGPSDYGRIPVRDERAAEAVAVGIANLLRALPRPWRLRLAQLPVDDPVAARVQRVLPAARLEPGQSCPRLTISPDRTLEQHMSSSGRRAARQGRDRLAKTGLESSIDRTREPAEIYRLLPAIVALHRTRDHALGRRSDLDGEPRRRFYIDVVGRLAEIDAIELFTLRLEGELVAFFLGLRDVIGGRTVYRSWDGRISSGYPHLALGRVLRAHLIEAILADPVVDEIDWMRGELQHKMLAVTHAQPAQQLLAESSPMVDTVLRYATLTRHQVRDHLPGRVRRLIRGHG